MIHHICELWEKIKENKPLVHCITNIVTVNDCANVLLAAGASPTMAHHELEVEEVTAGCESLVCNMGAMECLDAMKIACMEANHLMHPIVIDPVGAAGASFRREMCLDMIHISNATCVRGNYSEIKALDLERAMGTGVDVQEKDITKEDSVASAEQAARSLALKLKQAEDKRTHFVVASGTVDIISDGVSSVAVYNGSEMMAKVTGMGCMCSAMMGAFLGVENSFCSAVAACTVMGICGEIAAEETHRAGGGTGTFRMKFIDAVNLLTGEEIRNRIRCKTYMAE